MAVVGRSVRSTIRGRYCAGEGAKLRAEALLKHAEWEMRTTGAGTTIYAPCATSADGHEEETGRTGSRGAGLAGAGSINPPPQSRTHSDPKSRLQAVRRRNS